MQEANRRGAVMQALIALAVTSGALSDATAQVFKCTDAEGRTVFADRPCANGTQVRSTANMVGEASDRPDHIRAAIAEKRPAVGMRRAELLRALGAPVRQAVSQVGTSTVETLSFRLPNSLYAVTLSNGEVTAVSGQAAPQFRESLAPNNSGAAGSLGGCGSAKRIRELEMEISKPENRNSRAVQASLQRQLRYERECR